MQVINVDRVHVYTYISLHFATAGTLENLYGLFESMQKDIQHIQKEMQRIDKEMHLIQRASVSESQKDLELPVEAIQNRKHLASLDVEQVMHSFLLNVCRWSAICLVKRIMYI